MKFIQRDMGAAAEASSGGGRRGWWRELAVLLGSAIALSCAVYFLTGWAVDLVLPRISIEREMRWFSDFRPAAMGAERSGDNGDVELAAARRVLAKLRGVQGVAPYDYKLLYLPAKEPNAFALPGGGIAVTQGLFEVAGDDEIALAFVLGHELGHFAHRDQLRGLGRQLGRGLAFALLFGGDGGDVLSQHAAALLELGQSRAQEAAADRFAVKAVLRVYGRVEGADRLFRWLEAQDGGVRWTAFFSTHPAPGDRVEALRRYAEEAGKDGMAR